MRKLIFLMLCIVFAAAFGCGAQDELILSKTVKSLEGGLTFFVPDNWESEPTDTDIMVLKLTDNISAYAQIYYLAYDEEYLTLDDFIEECCLRYSDDFIGEVQSLNISGMSAKKFEYVYEDFTEYFEEAKFHGFEYFIDAPEGVIYVDIYHSLINPASETQQVSTKKQRELLENIVEGMIIEKEDYNGETSLPSWN